MRYLAYIVIILLLIASIAMAGCSTLRGVRDDIHWMTSTDAHE